MSAEALQPPALRPATKRRLADLLDNPDSNGQDLYARHTTEPGDPDVVRDNAAP